MPDVIPWPTCQQCGKEMYKFHGKYCSRKCSGLSQRRKTAPEKKKSPKKSRLICSRGHLKTRTYYKEDSQGNPVPVYSCPQCRGASDRAYRLGITMEEVLKLEVEDSCEICGSSSTMVVDHNHATGEIRGFLCNPCNLGLGQFKDNPETLEKAARYLKARSYYG